MFLINPTVYLFLNWRFITSVGIFMTHFYFQHYFQRTLRPENENRIFKKMFEKSTMQKVNYNQKTSSKHNRFHFDI